MKTALRVEDVTNLTYDELIEHIRMSKINSDEYDGVVGRMKEELALREPTVNYRCVKCEHEEFEEHQLRASGGGFSALFDLQTEQYRVITCKRCKYSELYQGNASPGETALDLVVGG